jgi:hypothetical protein
MSEASRRIPQLAKLESCFLESILPFQAIAHLTTLRRLRREDLEYTFSRWIRALTAHHRMTLGWVKSIENTPQRHIHVVLIAPRSLDCSFATLTWQAIASPRYSEAAIVHPYRSGIFGIGYVLKRFDSPSADVQFSDNIAHFAAHAGKSLFRTNSAQRRQWRRIKKQLERG